MAFQSAKAAPRPAFMNSPDVRQGTGRSLPSPQVALQLAADQSPRVDLLNGLQQSASAAAGDRITNSAPGTLQRYPIDLDEYNQNHDNPGVVTDSKHSWMRMKHRPDLGRLTFELLLPSGAPSGSLMIWEEAYDQYRFSPDGRDFDDSQFPPHFMEEITGSAEIDHTFDEPYSYVGEYGVGYRPARGVNARIELSGLIACIGFVLESENAGFACHMLVGSAPRSEAELRGQVNALAARYADQAGEKPEVCRLLYNKSQYGGQPNWLAWMAPAGIRTVMEPVTKDLKLTVTGHEDDPTVMWRGDPIRYTAPPELVDDHRHHDAYGEGGYDDEDYYTDEEDDPPLTDEDIDRAIYEHEKWADF